ncbi:conserved hypothetical protein; putative exported protein [Herminiimonas arsenicoxydans]|uniref:Lipoprotein n=1 Tax=Herminiimonas arsenicoxydans TaxID=204773 RepID=A4G8A9_HERAR|nr:conserved hypothetical protein; putative exported protein [Herminiimonas arsenicoxydans]
MIKRKNAAVAVLAMGMMAVALVGCQKQEGPAERAGKEVDQTINKAGEQIEKAGEKIQNAAEDAKK